MENRQLGHWWSGVRIQSREQEAPAECSSPFWNKFSCGMFCAVAIATFCCVYSGFSQGIFFYRKKRQRNKNNNTSSTCMCCSSCGIDLYSGNLPNGEKKALHSQPEASMMEQLVPEITTHALSYLDYPSLCRLSMTNSSMRRAANDDNAWKALYHKDFTTEQDGVCPPTGWKSYYAATKAVKDVNADYYRILRAKNIMDMSRFWLKADYVKCVHPGGQILTGYDSVMESWELALNWNQRYDCQVRDVRLRVLSDMAWVTLKEYVNAVVEPFLVTNIYEFHKGQWFMVHHHSSPTIEAGAADPGMFGG